MDSQVHVRFKFKVVTSPGQQIKLVGGHASLGSWDPEQGIEMSTDPYSYPFWTTRSILLPRNLSIEYKYLIISQESMKWESIPNRKLHLSKDAVIEDSENEFTSKVFYASSVLNETEEIFEESRSFQPEDNVLIVSLLLPITVSLGSKAMIESSEENQSLDSESEWVFSLTKGVWQSQLFITLQEAHTNFIWMGICGLNVADERKKEELSAVLLSKFKCIPIFVDADLLGQHEEFCSVILYKLLHNCIDLQANSQMQDSEELWNAYKRVNILFADAIMNHYSDQMIWIHGSQLFLTPSFISRKVKKVLNIGFFSHHPFPSSEIFRVFPYREAILHALCCCDLIGFHLFEYSRNFFSCCKRVLGVDIELTKGGYLGINYFGRHIMVRSEHIGIQPRMIQEICAGSQFKRTREELQLKYKQRKVLLSIDGTHELCGIHLKLNAFSLARKQFKSKVLLVQIIVSHSTTEKTQELKDLVYLTQRQINLEASEDVVEILERELTNEERYAYMSVSEGLIISCIKDGMCLQPFEYLIVKKDRPCGIVLSEFAGVSIYLNSPLKVNPFSIQDLANAIIELEKNPMTPQLLEKVNRDLKYIYSKNSLDWARKYLSDLKRANKDTAKLHYMIHGLGDKLKLIALKKSFRKLSRRSVLEAYNESSNRVFFFDNEGTLSNLMKQTEIDKKVGPSPRILKALEKLCEDEKNTVYVITGRPKDIVNNWFSSVPDLGMAAEYGAAIKQAHSHSWETISSSSSWKETAKDIMASYCEKVEGSSIIEKDFSVVFMYREADAEFGSYQSKELVSQLDFLLQPFADEVEVAEGLGYVEVKPQGINKGTAMFRIMEMVFNSKGPVDFMLAIGDDSSDEDMFKMAQLLKKQNSRMLLHKCIPCFTCTLGIKPSSAGYYLLDAAKVVGLLEYINGESRKDKRNFSYDDLRNGHNLMTAVSAKLKGHQAVLEADYE